MEDNIQTALDAGRQLAGPQFINGAAPFITIRECDTVIDLEKYLASPTRIRRIVSAHSLNGFVDYWTLHKGVESKVYVDLKAHVVTAIFDDDMQDAPSWRSHRLVYACPKSREHDIWFPHDGRQMDQEHFAAFIEQNMPDLASPPASDMLMVARELEAKKTVAFGQSIRLENGQNSLKYEEEIDGSTAKGQLKVPAEFSIAIPIFMGGPSYMVKCRLRYRIPQQQGKGLTMWFEIDRPTVIVDAAFAELMETLKVKTGESPIEATPDATR